MKKIIIYLFGMFLMNLAFAQVVIKSETFKLNKRNVKVDFLGKINDKFYVSFINNKDYQVAEYDNKLNFNRINVLLSQENNLMVEKILILKDTAVVFYSGNDGVNMNFYLKGFDFNAFNPEKDFRIFQMGFNRSNFNQRLNIVKSKDLLKALTYVFNFKSQEKQYIKFLVHNNKFEEINKGQFQLPAQVADIKVLDFKVDNNGDVFFFFKIRDRKLPDKNPDKYRYELYKCMRNNKPLIYAIEKDSLFLTSMKLKIDELNDNILLLGYLSKESLNSPDGVFVEILNKDLILKTKNLNYWDDETRHYLSMQDSKLTDEIKDLKANKVILRNDGGVILFGEEFFTTVVNYSSPNVYNVYSMNSITYYHYNNVLISSIDSTGKFEWNKLLQKRQVVEEEYGFSSLFICAAKTKLYCYFNDDIARNNNMIQYSIYPSGKIKSKNIFKDLIITNQSLQINENEWAGLIYNKGNLSLVKVNL